MHRINRPTHKCNGHNADNSQCEGGVRRKDIIIHELYGLTIGAEHHGSILNGVVGVDFSKIESFATEREVH